MAGCKEKYAYRTYISSKIVIFEKKRCCRVFSFRGRTIVVGLYWLLRLLRPKIRSKQLLLLLVIYQSSQSVLHAQWANERAVPSIAILLEEPPRFSFSVIERTDYVFLRNGLFCFCIFFSLNIHFGYAWFIIEEGLLLSNLFHLTQIWYHWKFQFVS